VLDQDPSNSEFSLRLKDFGWNPCSLGEFSRISIPLDSVGLWLQFCRHSISKSCFIFSYNLVAIRWLIREIEQREGGVDLQEVELILLSACSADYTRSPCRLSVMHGSAGCSSCSSRAHEFFRFDPERTLMSTRGGAG
jgi:hypothetical protein